MCFHDLEDILKINCNNWLKRTYDDFYGELIESEWQCLPFFAMSKIDVSSNDSSDKIHKYDNNGYWPFYFSISSDRVLNINNTLISFIIAKYIYVNWKIESYCTIGIYSNEVHFIYNESGLTVNKGFKEHIGEQHLHPISRNDLVFNYFLREYEGIKHGFENLNTSNKIISHDFKDSNDIVVHILKQGNGHVVRFSSCNGDPKYYLAKKPLNNPHLIEFECEGPAQRFIEYSNWQYQLTVASIVPQITETYRADKIWYDVILIDIIKKAYYSEDEIIVTSSTGEIIFMMKNKELVIDNKWQDYFSTFPVISKDYKVEDITNI